MKTRKLTLLGLLTAIALTIFLVEAQIPPLVPVPGLKLGLANIVTVFTGQPGGSLRAVRPDFPGRDFCRVRYDFLFRRRRAVRYLGDGAGEESPDEKAAVGGGSPGGYRPLGGPDGHGHFHHRNTHAGGIPAGAYRRQHFQRYLYRAVRPIPGQSGEIMENYFEMNLSRQEIDAISNLGLAHMGDCVFEILCRAYLCAQGEKTVDRLHRDTIAMVNATAQAKFVDKLVPLLTEEELAYYRRGKNAHVHAVPKSATPAQYAKATGLEALFGALYLAGQTKRINQLFRAVMEEAEKQEGEHGI